MTILYYGEMKCVMCHKKSMQAKGFLSLYIGESSSYELDFKPFNIAITFELKCRFCPYCGYAAPKINKKIKNAEIVMKKRKYKMQINNNQFPRTANGLLCYSMILEYNKNFSGAAIQALRAAWVCDTEKKIQASKICRKRFLYLCEEAKKNKQKIFTNEFVEKATIIDALRRIRHFKRAFEFANNSLKKDFGKDNNFVKNLIKFQMKLIRKKDSKIHMLKEVKF